nr:MAG TPA: hypothetical protein [Crassvirales sp.]
MFLNTYNTFNYFFKKNKLSEEFIKLSSWYILFSYSLLFSNNYSNSLVLPVCPIILSVSINTFLLSFYGF